LAASCRWKRDIRGMATKPKAAEVTSAKTEPGVSARRYARYVADIKLTVEVFRSGERTALWGHANEIGEDGVGGTLTGPVEPGEVVSMELSLPLAAQPIRLRALVRYRSGLRHGFEFLAVSTQQRDILRRVCEMLSSRL
jgi:PilZ domain-containing protein